MTYSSPGSDSDMGPWSPRRAYMTVGIAALASGICGGLVGGILGRAWGGRSSGSRHAAPEGFRPPLHGTNLGGWLLLEDWFFSGSSGRYVSTPDDRGQGACLPPEVPGLTEPWPSEGLLVHRLNSTQGPRDTVAAFEAHRRAYVGTQDFAQMADLGLKVVRVPLAWVAFADALAAIDPAVYGGFDPRTESVVVPDPYYTSNVSLVTIPRNLMEEMLAQASSKGLHLLFDIHCMPGGSSQGTYNGIYPLEPVFWKERVKLGNSSVPLTQAGLLVAHGLITWVESLSPELQRAVAGLTLMNEPAHMNAITGQYAQDDQVLQWIAAAADLFRKSTLPGLGVHLYVNLIETAFTPCCTGFHTLVPPWWQRTFSLAERSTWAVIDLHYYNAWSAGLCDGRTISDGAYFCDQSLEVMRQIWHSENCVWNWARKFQESFPDSLRSCSEMSGSTYNDAWLACGTQDVIRAFVDDQATAMQQYGIKPFFWTWHMPFGPNFERGWSLRYIAGLTKGPPPQPCEAKVSLIEV